MPADLSGSESRNNFVKKGWLNAAAICKAMRVSKKGMHKNNLYYLLPGMGRGARKRFWRNMILGVAIGILMSGLMGILFYYVWNYR